jgi:protein-tyrosine phosphatase
VIDLHTHVLPGIDDGAADLEDAVAMARLAVDDGILVLVATPHANVGRPHADVAERVAELQAALDAAAVKLRVLPGAEIALSPDVPARLSDRTLPTLAGSRYVLVELPFNVAPPNVEQTLFEIQVAGFVPVMAHAERYRYTQGTPERLAEWCQRGSILQVNAGSLRGDFGPGSRRAAEEVVRRGWPAVLASDAHESRRRRPELAFARALVAEMADAARAVELLEAGPDAIVADQPFPTPVPRSSMQAADDGGRIQRFVRRLLDR